MAIDRPHWSIAALLLVNLSGSLMAGFLRGVLEAKQQRGGARVGVGDGVGAVVGGPFSLWVGHVGHLLFKPNQKWLYMQLLVLYRGCGAWA